MSKLGKKDIIGIKGKDLNDNKTKHSIVFVFSNEKRRKHEKAGDFLQKLKMVFSREKRSTFSLEV